MAVIGIIRPSGMRLAMNRSLIDPFHYLSRALDHVNALLADFQVTNGSAFSLPGGSLSVLAASNGDPSPEKLHEERERPSLNGTIPVFTDGL